MKQFLTCSFIILILFSCKDKTFSEKKVEAVKLTNSFEISGTIENFQTNKVYLNKIIENTLIPLDSVTIKNNQFLFKGIVEYPERFALTFERYSTPAIFIVENSKFKVLINGKSMQDPIVIGSQLNNELELYKKNSKLIFKKIDYLFPQFQKARLENDVEKLKVIGKKMNAIENEFKEYTYNYIQKHKNSYVSAMLLRDQLKTTTIDTLKVANLYNTLNSEVKKCPDAVIIATTLHLH